MLVMAYSRTAGDRYEFVSQSFGTAIGSLSFATVENSVSVFDPANLRRMTHQVFTSGICSTRNRPCFDH